MNRESMDSLKTLEKKVKMGRVKKAILSGLSVGAVIFVGVLAPNAIKLFAPFINKNKNSRYNFWRSLRKLEEEGFVAKNNRGVFYLTDKGRNLLYFTPDKNKKRHWDGKWRIIIFDIPKNREKTRQKLRATIENYGFALLQKSVWAYPYPCEDLVTLLKNDLKLGKQLIYMVVEALEGDSNLKKLFGL